VRKLLVLLREVVRTTIRKEAESPPVLQLFAECDGIHTNLARLAELLAVLRQVFLGCAAQEDVFPLLHCFLKSTCVMRAKSACLTEVFKQSSVAGNQGRVCDQASASPTKSTTTPARNR